MNVQIIEEEKFLQNIYWRVCKQDVKIQGHQHIPHQHIRRGHCLRKAVCANWPEGA